MQRASYSMATSLILSAGTTQDNAETVLVVRLIGYGGGFAQFQMGKDGRPDLLRLSTVRLKSSGANRASRRPEQVIIHGA